MVLDRDEDMMLTGGRNPFLFKYKVAFDKNGKIKAVDVKAYCNAGYSMDYSFLVMECAYNNIINAYQFGSVRFEENGKKYYFLNFKNSKNLILKLSKFLFY
jgi:xanthine dehydrogenase molybdopterin-binding subunit B